MLTLKRFLLLLISLYSLSFSQVWLNVFDIKNVKNAISAIVIDPSGAIWSAGYSFDSLKIFDTLLTSHGYRDCFIIKTDTAFSSQPAKLLVRSFGGAGEDAIYDLVLKKNGNYVVTGTFQQSMTIGTSTLTAPKDEAFFLAEFAADSTPVWTATSSANAGMAVACNAAGNVVVTGMQFGNAVFIPGDTLFGHGFEDIFLAFFSNSGIVQWAVNIGGAAMDNAQSLDFFNDQIYIAGDFLDTLFIGNEKIAAGTYTEQSFVANYDTSGNLKWVRPLISDGAVFIKSIVIDSAGNLNLTGSFKGEIKIDTLTIMANNESALFLAQLSPDGKLRWFRQAELAYGNSITVGPNNDLFIAGSFKSYTTFGDSFIKADDLEDVFVCNYTLDGTFKWILTAGGCRVSSGRLVAVNSTHFFFTGTSDPDLVNKTCTILFGPKELVYTDDDGGRSFFAIADYTTDTIGVKRPPASSRHLFTATTQSITKTYDLLGREIPAGKLLNRGAIKTPFSAKSGTRPAQVIITDTDGRSSCSVLMR